MTLKKIWKTTFWRETNPDFIIVTAYDSFK